MCIRDRFTPHRITLFHIKWHFSTVWFLSLIHISYHIPMYSSVKNHHTCPKPLYTFCFRLLVLDCINILTTMNLATNICCSNYKCKQMYVVYQFWFTLYLVSVSIVILQFSHYILWSKCVVAEADHQRQRRTIIWVQLRCCGRGRHFNKHNENQ